MLVVSSRKSVRATRATSPCAGRFCGSQHGKACGMLMSSIPQNLANVSGIHYEYTQHMNGTTVKTRQDNRNETRRRSAEK
jgi:hypothetical protein